MKNCLQSMNFNITQKNLFKIKEKLKQSCSSLWRQDTKESKFFFPSCFKCNWNIWARLSQKLFKFKNCHRDLQFRWSLFQLSIPIHKIITKTVSWERNHEMNLLIFFRLKIFFIYRLPMVNGRNVQFSDSIGDQYKSIRARSQWFILLKTQ